MSKEFTTACVRLGNEQVVVHLSEAGVPLRKYAMFIREGKKLRKLTRDEELALAAAPATAAERAAAEERVGIKELQAVLRPRPFLDGEREQVVAQVERNKRHGGTNIDGLQ